MSSDPGDASSLFADVLADRSPYLPDWDNGSEHSGASTRSPALPPCRQVPWRSHPPRCCPAAAAAAPLAPSIGPQRSLPAGLDRHKPKHTTMAVVVDAPGVDYWQTVLAETCEGLPRSLSRPALDSFGLRFAVGTEAPGAAAANRLVVDTVARITGVPGAPSKIQSYEVADAVRSIRWVSGRLCLAAVGAGFQIFDAGGEVGDDAQGLLTSLPNIHREEIRDVQLSPWQRGQVLSGGFDGNVHMFDIERATAEIVDHGQVSMAQHRVHLVVSSVSWHPRDPHLVSCTTDPGYFFAFDTRTESEHRPALVFQTTKIPLYSHLYRSENEVILAHGDGTMDLFDLRQTRVVESFEDPSQTIIGDLVPGTSDGQSLQHMFAFGDTGVSMWACGAHVATAMTTMLRPTLPEGPEPAPGADHVVAGDYSSKSQLLCWTTSVGLLGLARMS